MRPELKERIRKAIPRTLCITRLSPQAGNRILLTFDDGPRPEVTPAVLQRLKAFKAQAVFFVVGQRAMKHGDLLRSIIAEGHIVGNHSFSHAQRFLINPLNYFQDLQHCQETVRKKTGFTPKLFRPPLGSLSSSSLFIPKLLGLKTVLWSLDEKDWNCRTTKEGLKISRQIMQKLSPRDIVLLHDDNASVIEILDKILPFIKQQNIALDNAQPFIC